MWQRAATESRRYPDFRQVSGYAVMMNQHSIRTGAALHPLLILSMAAGLIYPMLWDAGLPDSLRLAAKGSGIALLALYAATQARSGDGWLLAAVMAFGALGDVLLDIRFEAGALAFAIGHLIAIRLYLKNRQGQISGARTLCLGLLLLAALLMPWLLLGSRDGLPGLAVYALLLALMAATAWISRFPTNLVGGGALMFVVSDGLIVARMGPLADMFGTSLAVWLLYYLGQLLICVGVSRTLRLNPGAAQDAAAG